MTDTKERHLIVFARDPEPGQVKKRLAVVLGQQQAADLYKCMVEDTVCTLSKGQWPTTFFITPWSSCRAFEEWLGKGMNFSPQSEGNLGQRMGNAFCQLFESGWGKVVLIGTDIPTIRVDIIDQAYDELDRHDCVIGPAFDGGYYLIGFTAETFCSSVFKGVRWGSDQVLTRTAEILKSHNRRVKYLERLYDIDTLDDIRILRSDCESNRGICAKTLTFVSNFNL